MDDFRGSAFVAFVDISGFKNMMNEDENKALKALDLFYKAGYNKLQQIKDKPTRVEGVFVSDCGVLFTRKESDNCVVNELKILLDVVGNLNKRLVLEGFLLTTSIAYGEFKYENRNGLDVMTKNAIYGNAYVKAFMDNESRNPKLLPGQCRIIKANLPEIATDYLNSNDVIERKQNHYYYWWAAKNSEDMEIVNRAYDRINNYYADLTETLKNLALKPKMGKHTNA